MQEPHGEGQATHTGPESCAGDRQGAGEALTGERAGRVLSRENRTLRYADAVGGGRRPQSGRRYVETDWDPARSETPSMHGRISRENRESPGLPVADGDGGPGRGARGLPPAGA